MKNISVCLSSFKRFLPFFLVLFLLLNSLSVINLSDGLDNMDEIYTVSSIPKYYNLISVLPIKLVTEFFAANTANLIDVNKQAKQTNKKNSKKQKASNDIAYSSASFEHQHLRFNSNNHLNNIVFYTIENLNWNEFVSFCMMYFIFVMAFVGSMMLARGDTGDNVVLNQNILNKFRLI